MRSAPIPYTEASHRTRRGLTSSHKALTQCHDALVSSREAVDQAEAGLIMELAFLWLLFLLFGRL